MHYFFSDAHLGLGSPAKSRERERTVVRFLETVGASGAESLWIVGDLFDYWFDYRTVIPAEFVRAIGALAALVDAGIPVEYVIGNHDFGHYRFFEQHLGVTLHGGDVERQLAGRRVYISHGDGKAFNDTGYLILKRVLRSPVSNALWRILHPDLGIGIAAWASRRSRAHTEQKNYRGERDGEGDGLQAFARDRIERDGFDVVVMGHNHRPTRMEFDGGVYFNLGTWLSDRSYLVMDETTMQLRRFEGER